MTPCANPNMRVQWFCSVVLMDDCSDRGKVVLMACDKWEEKTAISIAPLELCSLVVRVNLVDPTSRDMLLSRAKPCMCQSMRSLP